MVLLGSLSDCLASTFDLTSYINAPFDVRELEIDLGQAFSRIDGASLSIVGNFAPGLLLATNWIPPRTYPADSFHVLIRLDDPGTTWLDKRLYARASLQGLNGDVAFEIPLRECTVPAFWPSGDEVPNWDFLLDGRFGLSVTSLLISLPGEVAIEPPHFTITELRLNINETPIPEPNCLVILIWGCLVYSVVYRGRR